MERTIESELPVDHERNFSREGCIQGVIEDFDPYIWWPLRAVGQEEVIDLEGVYLKGARRSPAPSNPRYTVYEIPEVSERLAEFKRGLSSRVDELTDEELTRLSKRYRKLVEQNVLNLITKAEEREGGFCERISLEDREQAEQKLKEMLGVERERDISFILDPNYGLAAGSTSYISPVEVIQDGEGNLRLFCPVREKDNGQIIAVVKATELFQADPTLAEQFLVAHHFYAKAANLIDRVLFSLRLHTVQESIIVPKVLRQLQATPEEEREMLIGFAVKVARLVDMTRESGGISSLYNFTQEYFKAEVDGERYYLVDWLNHMAECKGVEKEVNRRAQEISQIWERIKGLCDRYMRVSLPELILYGLIDEGSPLVEAIQRPFVFSSSYFDRVIEWTRAEVEKIDNALSLFKDIGDNIEVGGTMWQKIIERIKTKSPDYEERWGDFVEWLGEQNLKAITSIMNKDLVIESAQRGVSLDVLKDLLNRINEHGYQVPYKERGVDGAYVLGTTFGKRELMFSDEVLEALFYLKVLSDYKGITKEQVDQFVESLLEHFEKKRIESERKLKRAYESRRSIEEAFIDIGGDVSVLERIENGSFITNRFGERELGLSYKIGFITYVTYLLFRGKGIDINLKSPALRSLLEQLIPFRRDEDGKWVGSDVWEILTESIREEEKEEE